jgi:nicotinamidase/pyrazinamidase
MTITLRPTDILVVVDVQNDFLPGGSLAVPDGNAVIEPVNALIARFPHMALTQDWHPPGHASFASSHPGAKPFEVIELPYGPQVLWPDHCVQGTPGAAFSDRLRADKAELVVRKGFNPGVDSYSGFQEADRRTRTGLAGYLRERGFRRVFCAGLATDYCVAWTALDAAAAGFDTFVIEDASRGIDNGGSLARALADLDGAGVRRIRAGEVG